MIVIGTKRRWKHHNWAKNEDGSIDEFAWEQGYHNGPVCQNCYYSYCINCDEAEEVDKVPCETTEYVCPNCGKFVSTDDHFCSNCGIELEFSDELQIIEMEG